MPVSSVSRPSPVPDYAAFDPRERPWYRAAAIADGQIKIPPYVFFTTREVGITLARRGAGAKAVVGADITLRAISDALGRQRITPGTEIAVVERGRARRRASGCGARAPAGRGRARRRRKSSLAELGVPVLAALADRIASANASRRPRTSKSAAARGAR